jgi:hypothetical protein
MFKQCFVEMPFDSRFDGIWKAVIKPTVEGLNHKCIRGDDIFTTGSVLEDIFKQIKSADYVIADISIPNPNVYYELGYSHALDKKVILITQDISLLPFDLKHQRILIYTDSAQGAEDLKINLKKFINNL